MLKAGARHQELRPWKSPVPPAWHWRRAGILARNRWNEQKAKWIL